MYSLSNSKWNQKGIKFIMVAEWHIIKKHRCCKRSVWPVALYSNDSHYMGVSLNRGTPKSSILIRFSIINHPFWGTSIFGNTHMGPQFFAKLRRAARKALTGDHNFASPYVACSALRATRSIVVCNRKCIKNCQTFVCLFPSNGEILLLCSCKFPSKACIRAGFFAQMVA